MAGWAVGCSAGLGLNEASHKIANSQRAQLDTNEPRKFCSPPGQQTWVRGGGRPKKNKFWVRRFSLEKRSERPWPPWGRGEFSLSLVWSLV